MKTKIYIVLTLVMLIFITGCTKEEENTFNFEGDYSIGELVYNSAFSSYWGKYPMNHNDYYVFSEDTLLYYSLEGELLKTYNDIEYRSVEKDLDIDEMFSLFSDDFLDSVEYRFDIYSNDKEIGLSVFQSDTKNYIADTRYLGGSKDIFTIWSICELIEK